MIQQEERGALSGNVEQTAFSIELNGTMFDMLSSKVYNDRIKAVIREWSTNAVDACIDAGLPVNYDVHLPTLIEPYFSVRDYGTGMDRDTMLTLFSTMGLSTKRESNNFNGVFGIGRLAGLAYVKRFQVTSYLNGVQYAYAVSVNNGVPTMMHLGDIKTKEPNGLDIRVEVESRDIQTFKERSEIIYQWFDVKPKTNIELNYPKVEKVAEGATWYLTKEEFSYYSRRRTHTKLIMGNVEYSIDHEELPSFLSGIPLVIKAPIGAVSITPGRESLSYDKHTLQFIKGEVKRITKEFAKQFLLGCTGDTEYARCSMYNDKISKLGGTLRNFTIIPGSSVKGISEEYQRYKLIALDGVTLSMFNGRKQNAESIRSTQVSKNLYFMVNDMKTGFNQAAKEYLASLDNHAVVILISSEGKNLAKCLKYIKDIGSPDFVTASSYKVARKSKTLAKSFTYYSLNHWGKYRETSINEGTTYYYIPLSGTQYDGVTNAEARDLLAYATFLQNTGKKIKVIGVNKKWMSAVKVAKQFKPYIDLVKDYPEVQILNDSVIDYAKGVTFENYEQVAHKNFIKLCKLGKTQPQRNDVHYEALKRVKGLRVTVSNKKDVKFVKHMQTKYPLLQVIYNGSSRQDIIRNVKRYLELEDETKIKGIKDEK